MSWDQLAENIVAGRAAGCSSADADRNLATDLVTAHQCTALAGLTDADLAAGLPLAEYPALTPSTLWSRLVCCDGELASKGTSRRAPPRCCRVDKGSPCGAHWAPRGAQGACHLTPAARRRYYPPTEAIAPAPPRAPKDTKAQAWLMLAVALLVGLALLAQWRVVATRRAFKGQRRGLAERLEAVQSPD